MSQRSPYNDRYKVDRKGKTRKSASAAKPSRAVADLTPADSGKKSAKKKSRWSRSAKPTTPPVVVQNTPEMRRLRRIWWALWAISLGVAVLILVMQQLRFFLAAVPFVWMAWAVAMAGAFYLEFGPIRRLRKAAVAAATAAKPVKTAGSSASGDGSGKEGDA